MSLQLGKPAAPIAITPPAEESPIEQPKAEEEPKPKTPTRRRRTTRSTAASAKAEAAAETAEAEAPAEAKAAEAADAPVAEAPAAADGAQAEEAKAEVEAPAPKRRSRSRKKVEPAPEAEAPAEAATDETPAAAAEVTEKEATETPAEEAPRPTRRRSRARKAAEPEAEAAAAPEPVAEAAAAATPDESDLKAVVAHLSTVVEGHGRLLQQQVGLAERQERLLEELKHRLDDQHGQLQRQFKELELNNRNLDSLGMHLENEGRHLEKLQQELAGLRAGPSSPMEARQKVGVFVDVANVELAAERIRGRLDWKKVLAMLTKDRELVRAVAYSPVHEDINVSIESQRFVEPFLDSEYKVVTKPLKKFQDGSVKANVDIEIALDIINMLDRLDVVCLVSGDGDFKPLVESCQSRGVRVEVIGVGPTVARSLREAADGFIDLQERLRDLRA